MYVERHDAGKGLYFSIVDITYCLPRNSSPFLSPSLGVHLSCIAYPAEVIGEVDTLMLSIERMKINLQTTRDGEMFEEVKGKTLKI
jgi:hypothetical protein